MTALRGPDSSQDALLDEHAVVPETVDVNIRQLDPIPAPRYFIKELPLTDAMRDLVLDSRSQIRDVLHGRDPITPQYLCDLISWGAIGARNTESQVHRELASGMSMPIGFKNATDGSIKPAADSCFSAANEHHFLSINLDGQVISAETKGNPDCHLVLRGSSSGPNYDPVSVARALDDLKASKAAGPSDHGLIIDAAHGNCGKDEVVEAQVIEDIASRVAAGERGILGIMMESFLVGGHQDPAPLDQLVYGQSVTDACVPWDRTEQVLRKLADAVATRRAAAE